MRALTAALVALMLMPVEPVPAPAQTLGDLYRKVSPSVVIRAKGREVATSDVARFGEIGSGMLVTEDGKIVTARRAENWGGRPRSFPKPTARRNS